MSWTASRSGSASNRGNEEAPRPIRGAGNSATSYGTPRGRPTAWCGKPGEAPGACVGSPACPATPGTHARGVVGSRSHAPDAAGPALRADDGTSGTRP
ncbi:hypothetical protein DEJ48_14590 [Streptomyces venezuelae]|uniref:Uncharacterized protein n=1 Tax=Streptomyces venezuelae TaxID=54571 RepID=A0A5P2BVD8_STRVZ|nr:hypothetical protein DEJ48_14590 [Streptomyces venezuelae]